MSQHQQNGFTRLPVLGCLQSRGYARKDFELLLQVQYLIRNPQLLSANNLSFEKLSEKKLLEFTQDGQIADPSEAWLSSIAIQQFLARLDERNRQIVILIFWEGYSESDCAKHLGISQPAVSKRLKKLLALGRQHFDA